MRQDRANWSKKKYLEEEEEEYDESYWWKNMLGKGERRNAYPPGNVKSIREDPENIFSFSDEDKEEYEDPITWATNMVWWDIDTFPLSDASRAPRLLVDIQQWLSCTPGLCYHGPVELYAYGDKEKMDSSVWDQLVQGGGTYIHVPSQGPEDKDSCFNRMLEDMKLSAMNHHPPSNYLIISGDDRFDTIRKSLPSDYFQSIWVRPSSLSEPHGCIVDFI